MDDHFQAVLNEYNSSFNATCSQCFNIHDYAKWCMFTSVSSNGHRCVRSFNSIYSMMMYVMNPDIIYTISPCLLFGQQLFSRFAISYITHIHLSLPSPGNRAISVMRVNSAACRNKRQLCKWLIILSILNEIMYAFPPPPPHTHTHTHTHTNTHTFSCI